MKWPLAAAALAALGFGSAAIADPVFTQVDLLLDPERGVLAGEARFPDGRMQSIRIERPPLTEVKSAVDGYIGEDSALVPADAGWLPVGVAQAAGWDVRVTAPNGLIAVPYPDGEVMATATGETITSMRLDPVSARGPLVFGRFVMSERAHGDVRVRTFFTERNADEADAYQAAAAEAIETLSQRIGPYPFGAFAVVETPLPVGLGFPGFTLVSGRILPMEFMRGRSLWHEIAHVWWGNGVLVDYGSGNWAEGFATYFADYWLAERQGEDAARQMRYDWLLEYDAIGLADDMPLRRFVTKSHGQSQAIGYGKAAMVLYMLEREIGSTAFAAGIRLFWRENRFRTAGWRDVEAAFAAASGRDLGRYFQRWIDEAGAAPADPSDVDFDRFRALAPSERVATLRAAFAEGRFTVRPLRGDAPEGVAATLAALIHAGEDGVPVYVGGPEALGSVLAETPPIGGAMAIWASTDRTGALALGVYASDAESVAGLLVRARHYGRWSWLSVGDDGRPDRGRWPRQ